MDIKIIKKEYFFTAGFGDDVNYYHSPKTKSADENRDSAKKYCIDNKKDVTLFVMKFSDGAGVGFVSGKFVYKNGKAVYRKVGKT